MGTGIQGLLDTVAELKEKADVNAIFGEPVTVHERTIIPVAKVGYGFGVGFGVGYDSTSGDDEDEGENEPEATEQMGGGSGGGVQARPFAVIEVTPDSVRVESIVDEQKLALGALLLTAWGIFWTACTLIAIFAARTSVRLAEQD